MQGTNSGNKNKQQFRLCCMLVNSFLHLGSFQLSPLTENVRHFYELAAV